MKPALFDPQGFKSPLGPVAFLAVATLSQTGAALIQQGVAVLAVYFRLTLHLNLTQMGTLVSAISLGMITGLLIGGSFVDRKGPRWLLFWGSLWAVFWALVMSTLRGYPSLLGGLFFLGVGLAAVPSAGNRAIFEMFSGHQRGTVMGIRQTGVPVGAALAAALLPGMVMLWGLSGVFKVLALIIGITGMAFLLAIPGRLHRAEQERPRQSWRELAPALGPMTITVLLVAGQYSSLVFSMTDLHVVYGWSLATAGLGLAVLQVGGGLGRIGLGWWSDHIGGRRAPAIAIATITGSIMALVVAWMPPDVSYFVMLPVLLLLGFGTVGWNSLALTWAGERVPAHRAGQAMSLGGATVFLGSTIYPPVFGWVVDTTHQFSVAWTGLSALLLIALIVVWVVDGHERRIKALQNQEAV